MSRPPSHLGISLAVGPTGPKDSGMQQTRHSGAPRQGARPPKPRYAPQSVGSRLRLLGRRGSGLSVGRAGLTPPKRWSIMRCPSGSSTASRYVPRRTTPAAERSPSGSVFVRKARCARAEASETAISTTSSTRCSHRSGNRRLTLATASAESQAEPDRWPVEHREDCGSRRGRAAHDLCGRSAGARFESCRCGPRRRRRC